MDFDQALQSVPAFVLVFFRLAGLTLFAPLLGSNRIPRRVKLLFSLVLAAGMVTTIDTAVALPDNAWQLALAIGGEMAFGIAMGMILGFTFIAGQWAGEIVGQQMGLNISEVFDPQFGGGGSLVGDLYFMLTLVVFLAVGGHREMLRGVRMSFDSLPLLSLGIDQPLFETLVGLFQSCTTLAMQLAAPVLVTMLVVDLGLGCIGRAMPQMNLMTAGLSIRTIVGLAVVIVGMTLTVGVINGELSGAMRVFQMHWVTAR